MARYTKAESKARFNSTVDAAAAALATLCTAIDRHAAPIDTDDALAMSAAYCQYSGTYDAMAGAVQNTVHLRAAALLTQALPVQTVEQTYNTALRSLKAERVQRQDIAALDRQLYAAVRLAMSTLYYHCSVPLAEDDTAAMANAGRRVQEAMLDTVEAYRRYIASSFVCVDIFSALTIAAVSEEYSETLHAAATYASVIADAYVPPATGTYLQTYNRAADTAEYATQEAEEAMHIADAARTAVQMYDAALRAFYTGIDYM